MGRWMYGWIAGKEYNVETYLPCKRNICAFSIQAHWGFTKARKKGMARSVLAGVKTI